MSIRRDVVRTLGFQLLALAAGLGTNVIIARTLGPSGKGPLAFLSYTLFVVLSLGGLGLQTAAIQALGKRRMPVQSVAGSLLSLGLLFGLVSAFLLFLCMPLFQTRVNLEPDLLPFFLVVTVLALLHLHVSGLMIGLGKIRVVNRLQALSGLLWVAGAFVVLVVLNGDVRQAAFTWMAAQAVASLAALIWVYKNARPERAEFSRSASILLRFGLQAYAANLLWTLLLRADGFFLGYVQGAASLGIYAVAVSLAEVFWYLPRSLTLALNPRVASGTSASALELTQRAIRIGVWLVACGGLLMALVARPLVLLVFGPAFEATVLPLQLLLPGILAGAVASPLSLYFTQQKGQPRINAWCALACLALNVVLNLLWIPKLGPAGAALASTFSYSMMSVLLLWRVKREPGFSWSECLLLRGEDVRILRSSVGEMFSILRPVTSKGSRT